MRTNLGELGLSVADDLTSRKSTRVELEQYNTIKGYGVDEVMFRHPEWGQVKDWDKAREQFPQFDAVFQNINDKIAVDVGGGHGSAFFAYLKAKSLNPRRRIVVDLDPVALQSVRHYDGRERKLASFTDMPFKDGEVDIIFSNATTHQNHKIDREKFEECRRVINIDGVYIAYMHDGHEHNFTRIGFERLKLGDFATLYLPI